MNLFSRYYRILLPESFRYHLYAIRKYWNAPFFPKNALDESFFVFGKTNTLFIHIPKSAGVSVFQGLYGRNSFGHFKLFNYYDNFPKEEVADRFIFTFVRHPVDRLYSAYHYLRKGGRDKPIDWRYKKQLAKYTSFEDFVLNGLHNPEILSSSHFQPQVEYVKNKEGKININFIGKYESLEEDYQKIADTIGATVSQLPKLNINAQKKKPVYSRKVLDKIHIIYQEDFKAFGYSLDL